ncbi:MAG: hypothetical protein R3F21_09060 [Myxococcota bacterium]
MFEKIPLEPWKVERFLPFPRSRPPRRRHARPARHRDRTITFNPLTIFNWRSQRAFLRIFEAFANDATLGPIVDSDAAHARHARG